MINKRAMLRFLNILVWIVIAVLATYILLKSTVMFSETNVRQTMGNLGNEIVSEASNKLLLSSSPLLQYVNQDNDRNYSDNLFLRFAYNAFPINHYCADEFADNLKEENDSYSAKVNSLNYDSNELSAILEENGYYDDYLEDAATHETSEDISFIRGETYFEDVPTMHSNESKALLAKNRKMIEKLKKEKTYDYLITNFYTVDSGTKAMKQLFNASKLLKTDVTLKSKKNTKPQILICHTHSQEDFIDSKKGVTGDTIVGVGKYLANILSEEYGYNVIHDTTTYDIRNGKLDRSKAYNYALPALEKTLKDNPSIDVVIDLHRNGVLGKDRWVTNVNGKKTAQLMFFNGLCRNNQGPIGYLKNPNISGNLAFSLQLHLKGLSEYPSLMRKIYLKDYRYNQHLVPKYLLIELGNQNNTVQEAKNSMEPLANILDQVLKGK